MEERIEGRTGMSGMDEELREALGRRSPAEGFADRVMERVRREGSVAEIRGPAARPVHSWWRAAAIAATILVLFGVGTMRYEKQRRERERAEAAKDQLFTALRLTAGKLQMARARIVNIGYEHDAEGAGNLRQ